MYFLKLFKRWRIVVKNLPSWETVFESKMESSEAGMFEVWNVVLQWSGNFCKISKKFVQLLISNYNLLDTLFTKKAFFMSNVKKSPNFDFYLVNNVEHNCDCFNLFYLQKSNCSLSNYFGTLLRRLLLCEGRISWKSLTC